MNKQLHQALIRTLVLIETPGLTKSSSSWKNAAKAIKKILRDDENELARLTLDNAPEKLKEILTNPK